MKIGTLFLAYEALEQLFKANLPVRTAFSLHKVIEPIRRELNDVESMRVKLVDKHTKNGEVNRESFLADYNQLMEEDSKLTLPPVTLVEVLDSDAKISPIGLNILISTGILTED